ncbi:MAG: radical SAM protein [Candidatus Omnitrophica bacterium]|nr:radical SAM protein [Candidatus Omnitrophota bacterium]
MNITLKRFLAKIISFTSIDNYFLKFRKKIRERNYFVLRENILKRKNLDFPVSITIEPSLRCNLRCFMCYQSSFRKKYFKQLKRKELSAREWINFLKKSRGLIKRIGFTGGEPFIREDIFEIFDCCDKLKILFNIITNGVLINKEKAKKLQKCKFLDGLVVSLHGPKNIHEEITGVKNSFNKVTEALRLIVKKNFWVGINCVVSERNIEYIDKLVIFCSRIGVDGIGFQLENFISNRTEEESLKILKYKNNNLLHRDDKKGNYKYTLENLLNKIFQVKKIARKSGIPITFAPSIFYDSPELVYYGNARKKFKLLFCEDISSLRIDYQGNVTFCSFFHQSFGNIKNDSLRKIWNSNKLKEFRYKLISNNLIPACDRCCKLLTLDS